MKLLEFFVISVLLTVSVWSTSLYQPTSEFQLDEQLHILQRSAFDKFNAYVSVHSDSAFAKQFIMKEEVIMLIQTTYEFKHSLFNEYMKTIAYRQITNENIEWIEFDIIQTAISNTCESYAQRIDPIFAEVLRLLCVFKPIAFFKYLYNTKRLQEPRPNNLSNDDELEDGIKRYFFGYYIGNRLLKNNRDPPKIEHKKYADGDEACDFDNYIFNYIVADLRTLIRSIKQKGASKISKREVTILPIRAIDDLHDTSQRFKQRLVTEFLQMLMTDSKINPHRYAYEKNKLDFEVLTVQRKWQAFYAFRNVCWQTMTEYSDRINGTLEMQIGNYLKKKPIAIIVAIHNDTMTVIKNKSIAEDLKKYDRNDLYKSIQHNYGLGPLRLPPAEEHAINTYYDLFSEPGLGDENDAFNLTHFDEICTYALKEFDSELAKIDPSLSGNYRIARRRLIDMRFKTPMRFRKILCDHYEIGNVTDQPIEVKRKYAFDIVSPSLDTMFEHYANRIKNYDSTSLAELMTIDEWRKTDPFYFMFHMHIEVIENRKIEVNYVSQFINDVNKSRSVIIFSSVPLPESFIKYKI